VVIEAGAGSGMLARAVLRAAPACLPALTYVLVEQSAALRARHGDHLPMTAASHALPPVSGTEDDSAPGGGTTDDVATGPRLVSLPDLPIGPFTGIVLANELLDNLPVKLLTHDAAAGWREIRVGLTADEDDVAEYVVPADAALVAVAERLVPEPTDGARVPLQLAAGEWVRRASGVLDRGRVVLIDYADSTPSMAARQPDEWLRTYRDHARGSAPLEDLGLQDITCEVAVDQLARVRPELEVESQADFLRRHGVDELVEHGRRVWHERGGIGDLAAIEGRSRVNEAAALLDPDGLGAFTVLTWTV
jgi:SAM-dependent MidA family methyltransferase